MRRPTGLATRIIMSNAWQDPEVPARSATHQTDSSIMAKLLKIAKTKDVPPGQAAAFTIEGQKIALFNVEGITMPSATPARTVADRCRKATFKAPGSPVRGTVRIST
jgi:hypothetical protein